jgi:hypothetical protein
MLESCSWRRRDYAPARADRASTPMGTYAAPVDTQLNRSIGGAAVVRRRLIAQKSLALSTAPNTTFVSSLSCAFTSPDGGALALAVSSTRPLEVSSRLLVIA